MEFLKNKVSDILITNTTAQTRAVSNLDEIIDIIDNGITSANAYSIPNLSTTSTNANIAKTILLSNLDFLKAEYISHIINNFPTFVFDEPAFAIDLEENFYATIYDFIYGGNSASVSAGLRFFDPNDDTSLISGQTGQIVSGINHLLTLIQNVVTSTPILVANLEQTVEDQVLGGSATVTESDLIKAKLNIIKNIILTGVVAAPTIELGSTTSISSTLVESKTRLQSFRSSLQSEVLVFLNLRFNYNKETCKRDTGYIVDAVAHDVFYNGNLKQFRPAYHISMEQPVLEQ